MLKIDYLYCGLNNHNDIYAIASNDTHTVFVRGKLNGQLKSSIRPLDLVIHNEKVKDMAKPYGLDDIFYLPTTKPEVIQKVNQHLFSINFMTTQTLLEELKTNASSLIPAITGIDFGNEPDKSVTTKINTDTIYYTLEDNYFITCICNAGFEDRLEVDLDYPLLSLCPSFVTCLDKYGDEFTVPRNYFGVIKLLK